MRGRIPDSFDGFRRRDLAENPMRRPGRRAEDGHHLAPAKGEARPAAPGRALGQRSDSQEDFSRGQGSGRRSKGCIPLFREGQLCDFGAAVEIPGTYVHEL